MDIETYISLFYNEWKLADTKFSHSMAQVSSSVKRKNEIMVEKMVFQAEQKLRNNYSDLTGGAQPMSNKLYFLKNVFSFSENEINLVQRIIDKDVSREFVQMALDFDSEVKMEDVFQAGRNLWIVNSLQILMGLPVELSKSVFAYCMLYPYTDDYLDNPEVGKSEKINFSKRFRMRLQGESLIAVNELETKIFDLVSFIESDWPRNRYPKVYESLVAIHDAQTRSISLVHKGGVINAGELMLICIDKGGTSVLADGYLLKGVLTSDEEAFCFGFGTYLQFVDDIQDLKEDVNDHVATVFANAANCGMIEAYVNKTLSFGNRLMEKYLDCYPGENTEIMRSLMLKSVYYLLVEAIALNSRFFSSEYVSQFETFAPFSYSFIQKRRDRMNTERLSSRNFLKKYFKENRKVAI
ncbi:MAG: class 1 isoprenoid biosynthesis enzyme [Prolixibacteraceae bacterium]|nr:class 1 isoprenoid biosynthesis enzyme [Prolixibacteraceae bacterium]